jgi:putative nucleotidyltransferase with HDIG domain
MNNPFRKTDKSKRRVSGFLEWFPSKLYASYLIPALFLLCVGISIIVIDWLYVSDRRGFAIGGPSPRTYRAIYPISFFDVAITDKLRDNAGDAVLGVVTRNVGASDRMKLRLEAFRNMSVEDAEPQTPGVLTENFTERLLDAFKALPEDQRDHLLSAARQVGGVYFDTLSSADIGTEWKDKSILWAEINKHDLSPVERNLVYQLLDDVVEPRFKTDPRLTAFVRGAERREIPIVERRMEVGDVIVRRGETVTTSIADSLREQGYLEDKFQLAQVIVMCILILVTPLWMDVVTRQRSGKPSDPAWGRVVFVVTTAWICEAAAARLAVYGGGVLAAVTVSYLCMPRRIAFHIALAGATSGAFLTAGLSTYGLLSFLILSFAGAMIGFYAFKKIESLKELITKVFFITIFLAVIKEAVRALLGLPTLESMALSWPLVGTWLRISNFLLFELAATLLAVLSLLASESYIGAFSALKAMELSNPSNPLLRKLQAEAPGTYHHSLMIGALAGTVANELGIDESIMRVGAYYHDIGKMRRPRHFVENQLGGENIHDTLSPTLSAMAIIAHVREGIELANEFRLPNRVKHFIAEHHGTTCVSYFYKKALAQGENVERIQFCYPGPKPQSRETALLMLMDSIEAAVRSENKNISKITDIQEIIARVINVKSEEGQLYDADFTFRELELIKEASLKALRSMYHTRTVKEIKDKKGQKI